MILLKTPTRTCENADTLSSVGSAMIVDIVDKRGCRWAEASRMTGADDDAKRSSSSVSPSSNSSSSTTDLRFLRAVISLVYQSDLLEGVAWNDRAITFAAEGLQTHLVRAAVTNGRMMLDIVYR
jgi:hypothetical protein